MNKNNSYPSHMLSWCNWQTRMAQNHDVVGSSPTESTKGYRCPEENPPNGGRDVVREGTGFLRPTGPTVEMASQSGLNEETGGALLLNLLCGCAGTGRQARLRGVCP